MKIPSGASRAHASIGKFGHSLDQLGIREIVKAHACDAVREPSAVVFPARHVFDFGSPSREDGCLLHGRELTPAPNQCIERGPLDMTGHCASIRREHGEVNALMVDRVSPGSTSQWHFFTFKGGGTSERCWPQRRGILTAAALTNSVRGHHTANKSGRASNSSTEHLYGGLVPRALLLVEKLTRVRQDRLIAWPDLR